MILPIGSKIKSEILDKGSIKFYWYNSDGGIMRYIIGIFILIWLIGWFFGFTGALDQLQNTPDNESHLFITIWLLLWTIGGFLVSTIAYLILRPQRPEYIILKQNTFYYDSGTNVPISMLLNMRKQMLYPFGFWSAIFKKRIRMNEVSRDTVKFVHEKNPSRIYFDVNFNRIIIGSDLSEPEIDWLYSQLEGWTSI